jgi:hypothetical protein
VWFKAARPAFAHDARVLSVLQPLAPDLLPDVVAATDDGWLLLADAGERAREHPIDWRAMLHAYAALQRASAAHVDALLAAGAYDNRPATVVERVRALLRYLPTEIAVELESRLPHVAERIERLAASKLPITIDHGDLHDGNVFSSEGRVCSPVLHIERRGTRGDRLDARGMGGLCAAQRARRGGGDRR